MTHELIERYIYAVARRLPAKVREDVEQELAGLIADMLEARCGAVQPEEKDIRIVLTELGSPGALAAKYSGDEGRALISGEYFRMYKFMLKLVLPIAAGGMAFALLLSLLLEGDTQTPAPAEIFVEIMKLLAGIVGGSIQAFAIITVIFAVFERKKVSFGEGDFIDALPLVPSKNERIPRWEPIAGMAWGAVAAVFFLGFPQVAGWWFGGAGWTPIFDAAAIRSLWLPIVLWAVLGIGTEALRLIEGRYTRRLAIVMAAANLCIAASVIFVFAQSRIINAAFAPAFREFLGDIPLVGTIFAHFNLFFLAVVLFALAIETVTAVYKGWKHTR